MLLVRSIVTKPQLFIKHLYKDLARNWPLVSQENQALSLSDVLVSVIV